MAFLSGFFTTLSDRLGLPPTPTIEDIQERFEELGSWLSNVVADYILRNP